MPHVVLLGFVSEDVKRNLYLYRGFYQRREIHPYTKPRFYLESDELKLINVPPIPPQELPDVLDDFDSWEWAKHDYFYDPSDYQDRVWRKSKFLSLGLEVADRLRKKLRTWNRFPVRRARWGRGGARTRGRLQIMDAELE